MKNKILTHFSFDYGSWAENKLSMTLDFAKHESIAVTGSLKDGRLAGEFRTEGFVAKWEAKKKQ